MKRWGKIAIRTAIAIVGATLTQTNILWWFVGMGIGKFAFQLILSLSLAVIVYLLLYALVIGGLFWILIS